MTAIHSPLASRRRGLTLVELLASAVILSAAGTAMATIVRDATAASRRADLTRRALRIYDEWLIARSAAGREGEEAAGADAWEQADDRGRRWSVRIEVDTPVPQAEHGEKGATTRDRIVWGRVTIELIRERSRSADIAEPILTIHRAEPRPSAEGAQRR